MSNYDLYNGDCLEVMQDLIDNDVKVDLILTDPPYGVLTAKWDYIIPLEQMWECISKISKENAPTLLFSNDIFGVLLKQSNIKNYKYQWVWNKEFSTNFMLAKKRPLIPLEYVNVFYSKQPTYNPQRRPKTIDYDGTRNYEGDRKIKVNHNDVIYGTCYHQRWYIDDGTRYPINYLEYNSQRSDTNNGKRFHPSQKPVSLLEYFIKTYTKEGEMVLDFTMGSGSTGVACMNTNRNFIGIELDENYYNIAVERIKKANQQTRLM